MRRRHPPVAAADPAAASWICWRDDDEWENPFAPLVDMVRAETGSSRFLEPEVLDETVLTVISNDPAAPAGSTPASSGEAVRPKFCTSCGAPILRGAAFAATAVRGFHFSEEAQPCFASNAEIRLSPAARSAELRRVGKRHISIYL